MYLFVVFAIQILRLDVSGLKESSDEGSGAGEGIEDVDARIGEGGLVEVLVQGGLGGANHEIDNLDRCVDDTEELSNVGKSSFEEPPVEIFDDVLAGLAIRWRYAFHSAPDRPVELIEVVGLRVEVVRLELVVRGRCKGVSDRATVGGHFDRNNAYQGQTRSVMRHYWEWRDRRNPPLRAIRVHLSSDLAGHHFPVSGQNPADNLESEALFPFSVRAGSAASELALEYQTGRV